MGGAGWRGRGRTFSHVSRVASPRADTMPTSARIPGAVGEQLIARSPPLGFACHAEPWPPVTAVVAPIPKRDYAINIRFNYSVPGGRFNDWSAASLAPCPSQRARARVYSLARSLAAPSCRGAAVLLGRFSCCTSLAGQHLDLPFPSSAAPAAGTSLSREASSSIYIYTARERDARRGTLRIAVPLPSSELTTSRLPALSVCPPDRDARERERGFTLQLRRS